MKIINIIVIVEGPTEETFINDVVSNNGINKHKQT